MKLLICFLLSFTALPVFAQQNYRCVQNCADRDYRGTCIEAAPDYCGVDAKCARHCVTRAFNGVCVEFDADFCGANATCKERCVASYNGHCDQYGEDHCYTYTK